MSNALPIVPMCAPCWLRDDAIRERNLWRKATATGAKRDWQAWGYACDALRSAIARLYS